MTGPGYTEPLVPHGHRATAADWEAAEAIVRDHGRVLFRTRPITNQATTVAAKLNKGPGGRRGYRAFTEYLEPDGPVGIYLEVTGRG